MRDSGCASGKEPWTDTGRRLSPARYLTEDLMSSFGTVTKSIVA